ncbi:hypothetical protein [Niabella sp.]|uniref:hypothetical protein n=1 Tax=Niabella sp. TaxID=1962976 RepID=UPI002608CAEA|nr:hypothetical protein [Niabella sp.]
MENIDEYTRHQRTFESLLRTKGYNDRFDLISKATDFRHFGTLRETLHQFLAHMARGNVRAAKISLKTYAEYRHPDDYKECQFVGEFNLEKGFVIDRVFIESRYPNETQQMKLRNNNDLPSKNAVVGRFRRPRVWDRQMKGDFKIRRKR